MSRPTIAIKQADGTFYPILEEGSPSKKRIVLTPAAEEVRTARIEIYRGLGPEMDQAGLITTLNLDGSSGATEDIELVLSLDDSGEFKASAGFVNAADRQEYHEVLGEFDPEAFGSHTEGRSDQDLLSDDSLAIDGLGDIDELENHEGDANPFDFDMDDDETPPRADQDILNDDSLAADGLDDFTFDLDEASVAEESPVAQAESGGPVEEDSLGDLGSFDSAEDFSMDLPAETDETTEVDQSFDLDQSLDMDLDQPMDLDQQMDLDQPLDLDQPSDLETSSSPGEAMEDFGDLGDFSLDETEPSSALSLDSSDDFGSLEDAPLVKGPDDFNLDLGDDFPGETKSAETSSSSDDFSMDDDFGSSLEGDLNFDSPGEISNDDFSLGGDFSMGESTDDSAGFELPPVPETKPQAPEKGPAARRRLQSDQGIAGSTGKLPLVLSLGSLVILLGIFLGLLFLTMTRMTLIPPVQTWNQVAPAPVASSGSELSTLDKTPVLAGAEDQKRLESLNWYGTVLGAYLSEEI